MNNTNINETQDALEIQAKALKELQKKINDTYQNIQNNQQKVEELKNEIEEQHNLICVDDDEGDSLSTEIKKVRDEANNNLKDLQDKIKDFSQYYNKVFGIEEASQEEDTDQENSQKTNKQKGLRQELEEYEKSMKTKFLEWEKEIEDLLGRATNASLASSYRESRQSYEKSIRAWNGFFIVCMIALFLVAITMDFQKIDLSNPYAILSLFLARIPFFIPFIWLAIFSTRRRNEIKRLQEEYRHKETIAKSYSGYKKQIEKVGDDDGKLAKQLMENLVAMTNDNPNKALDKIKQENTPSLELLEKIRKFPKETQEAIIPLLETFLKFKK